MDIMYLLIENIHFNFILCFKYDDNFGVEGKYRETKARDTILMPQYIFYSLCCFCINMYSAFALLDWKSQISSSSNGYLYDGILTTTLKFDRIRNTAWVH
jgi:hypothetical protein